MNVELSQYYNSLAYKDKERIPYFYDILAVNNTSGISFKICSIAQNPKKATGAERFKELVTKAEAQKYDLIKVTEYGADGVQIVNQPTFKLGNQKNRGKGKGKGTAVQPYVAPAETLEGFERSLSRLGYVNGFDGVIAASAEKMNQAFILQQQSIELNNLKQKVEALEKEKEQLRKETDVYRDRYKEILDEKKEMERDHKYEVQSLSQKNTLGSLAVNGLLGFLGSRPAVASMLAGVFNAPPTSATQPAPTTPATPTAPPPAASSSDDDDDVVAVSSDPKVKTYIDYINHFCASLDADSLEKVATVIQYLEYTKNFDYLTTHCKQKYQEYKQTANIQQ